MILGIVLLTLISENICFQVGTQVGQKNGGDTYILTRELSGLHGSEVFAAESIHHRGGSQYLVKIISFEAMKQYPILRMRVENDLAIRSSLDHSNIMDYAAHWDDGVNLFVVTELCLGGRLSDVVRKRILRENEIKVYTRQLISLLSYLKSKRVALNKLSLDSIYICRHSKFSKFIKVVDFGAATQYSENNFDFEKSQSDVLRLGLVMRDLLYAENRVYAYPLTSGAKDLLYRALEDDPARRITIEEAQKHTWLN